MNLWAISDLHLRHEENRRALAGLVSPGGAEDWLIVAGDVGETEEELAHAWGLLNCQFAQVLWVPGNHELWSSPNAPPERRGEGKYRRLVEICRAYDVITPEDPYPRWPGPGPPRLIAPLFLLYDYTFGPDGLDPEAAVAWAMEAEILCADEMLLAPDPYPTRQAWCAARCRLAQRRLAEATADPEVRTVLVNHWPLRRELAVLPAIPRFRIWCGTRRTEDWHQRFRAEAVVYGHLHIPRGRTIDGVRFEEVSLGYPRQWQRWRRDPSEALRRILPGPDGAG